MEDDEDNKKCIWSTKDGWCAPCYCTCPYFSSLGQDNCPDYNAGNSLDHEQLLNDKLWK
jgi:hypothetical protein